MRLDPGPYGCAVGTLFMLLIASVLLAINSWWFAITRNQWTWIMGIGPCAGIIGYFIRRARP